jgi:MFS family permease
MDKAILLGASLIALTFVLAFILSSVGYFLVGNSILYKVLVYVVVASFPIGALIVLIRIMQWAKFRFHKGTLFGLFLIGVGQVVLIVGTPYNGLWYHTFFNDSYVRLAALAGIFGGILILTIKTAIWGSKYIEKSDSKKA